jgi:hypothetical protein
MMPRSAAPEQAARRGAMKSPGGKLEEVRAARLRIPVGRWGVGPHLGGGGEPGTTARTEAGIAVALRKAKEELRKLERRHDEDISGDESHVGAHAHEGARPPCHGTACLRS